MHLTGMPYARRRAELEALFAGRGLVAPFTLHPSTTDPATATEWLTWTAAGVKGLCFKRLDQPYTGGGRAWHKYKVRATTEAIVGAVSGSLAAPRTVLLGRYDAAGRLRYVGRTTTSSQAASRALADRLIPAPAGGHPWEGWTFAAGWGTTRVLDVLLVQPEVVLEVAVDTARDAAGRWRHPALSTASAPTSTPAACPGSRSEPRPPRARPAVRRGEDPGPGPLRRKAQLFFWGRAGLAGPSGVGPARSPATGQRRAGSGGARTTATVTVRRARVGSGVPRSYNRTHERTRGADPGP
ncbi:hypothetical protein [Streptomyces sp. DH12]|uniref:hypothetical protein n=1 Tax=Streptomyces sp. DH12 TaxID=2857010 RepID=UPI001E2E5323|nr:hypothetical protein [Streptomyces sp. DH12]